MASALSFLALVLTLVSFSESKAVAEILRQVTEPEDEKDSRGAQDVSDMVSSLPGAPDVPFKMYSGYITVDKAHGRALFYWFVECVTEPTKAPVTLWLNGGPGCSSVGGGTLSELGPFFPHPDGATLKRNPHSWNKVSNIIFLESPAGVGFSYSNTTSDYTTGDSRTSADALAFLVSFFAKYPKFAKNPLYVAGESYGGHYVPQLAEAIVVHNRGKKDVLNFQGFFVGNAWTDPVLDNYGAAFYWWTHAIISDGTFYGISNTCNFSAIGPLSMRSSSDKCDNFVSSAQLEMGNINIYDIYADMCMPAHVVHETRHFANQLAGSLSGKLLGEKLTSSSYDPCVDNEVENYLNRKEVQEALHANVTKLPYRWTDCSERVSYSWTDMFTSVLPVYRRLLKENIKIFVFSGDIDAIVPVTGTRSWISKLVIPIKENWRPYYVNSQVGGYITEYEGLTFATVRHAGHMVPYTQPERALSLFSYFIGEQKL